MALHELAQSPPGPGCIPAFYKELAAKESYGTIGFVAFQRDRRRNSFRQAGEQTGEGKK